MRKIEILGREVEMMYCAATETGFEDIAGKIKEFAKPGDIVLTIGAGTITKLSDLL